MNATTDLRLRPELEPCPLCAGRAGVMWYARSADITCRGCGLRLSREAESYDGDYAALMAGIVAEWNRRAPNWKPIDASTPRDKPILVPNALGRVTVAKWDEDKYSKSPQPFFRLESSAHRTLPDREYQPQVWAPVPTPPAEETADV